MPDHFHDQHQKFLALLRDPMEPDMPDHGGEYLDIAVLPSPYSLFRVLAPTQPVTAHNLAMHQPKHPEQLLAVSILQDHSPGHLEWH